MPRATEIALRAYERALLAADLEAAHQAAIQEDRERTKIEWSRLDFEAALPLLNEWFPGVSWVWEQGGDYGYDCIIMEETDFRNDLYDLLKLRAERIGSEVEIEIGDYQIDEQGYHYWSGGRVNSAADIGRYLKNAIINRYGK